MLALPSAIRWKHDVAVYGTTPFYFVDCGTGETFSLRLAIAYDLAKGG